MAIENLYGRDATDPLVHAEVLKSIREMSFHDLVAQIEGEAAAETVEQYPIAPVTMKGTGFMAANNDNSASHNSLPGNGVVVPMSCPPFKRGY